MKKPLSLPSGRTVALFIDLQEEHRQDPRYRVENFDDILANVGCLQAAARRAGVSLIHCAYVVDLAKARPFHPLDADGKSAFSDKDDPLIAICPEIAPVGAERLLVKDEATAFGPSSLAADLKAQGVEWVAISGVWTEACVDATVKDAVKLGFRVLLVKDACGSGTATMHEIGILNLANRLYGGAVVDTEAACRLLAGDTVDAWQIEGSVPLRYTFETASGTFASL